MLPNSKGIPGNPTNEQILGSTEKEMAERGFVTKGDLFE